MPARFYPGGIPFGIQLMAPQGRDRELLTMAGSIASVITNNFFRSMLDITIGYPHGPGDGGPLKARLSRLPTEPEDEIGASEGGLKAVAPSLPIELGFASVRTSEQFGPAFSDQPGVGKPPQVLLRPPFGQARCRCPCGGSHHLLSDQPVELPGEKGAI